MAVVLATSASFAGQATFESVQKEFQQKVLSLLSEKNAPRTDLHARIATFANETYGAHSDLMRKEAERRFRALPQFPAANLAAYVEHKSWEQFPLPPVESGWVWLTFGWDPEKLADAAKKTILSRQLGIEAYGRLALINVCCPDKVYRLGKGTIPDLVVDSLGDLFVVDVEMTKVGACKPVSVRWMKKKARGKEPPPAE
jgi:hypothetical protein